MFLVGVESNDAGTGLLVAGWLGPYGVEVIVQEGVRGLLLGP